MEIAPAAITAAIASAPAWALVSLTMPDADLRERGVEELGRWIAERLDLDQRQIPLPLA